MFKQNSGQVIRDCTMLFTCLEAVLQLVVFCYLVFRISGFGNYWYGNNSDHLGAKISMVTECFRRLLWYLLGADQVNTLGREYCFTGSLVTVIKQVCQGASGVWPLTAYNACFISALDMFFQIFCCVFFHVCF